MGATVQGRARRAGGAGALLVAAVVVVVLAVVQLWLPVGRWRAAVEVPVYLGGAGAVAWGMRRHRPVSVVAWWALATALVVFAASSAAETVELSGVAVMVTATVEAVLDVLGYLALTVAGLAALVTGRARRDRESWVDAFTLLLAAALTAAVWADEPDGMGASGEGVFSPVGGELGVGLSLLTGVVLIAGARLALPGRGRSVSGVALFTAGVLALVGYAGKATTASTAAATTAGSAATAVFSASAVFDVLPLLAVAAVKVAAAHPSMTALGEPAPPAAAVTMTRLLGLGAALLVSPALVLLWTVRHGGNGYLLGTGIGALTALTLWRIGRLVGDRERTRSALMSSEARLQALLQHAADVIAIVDGNGRISYVSPALTPLLGWAPADLTGTRALTLLDRTDRPRLRALLSAAPPHTTSASTTAASTTAASTTSARHVTRGGAFAAEVSASPVTARDVSAGDVRLRHADGGTRWVEVRISRMLDEPGVAGWVVNAREVTERKHLEQRLRQQASTDSLTGLANRSEFLTRLSAALAPGAGPSAVLFLDLDDFKTVNDRWGHATGDVLLGTVAARLRGCLRATDTAARLGGDEFAILLTPADSSRVQRVAARVLDELRHPLQLNGHTLHITASIGGAVTRTGDTPADVLHRADSGMYAAKRHGKNHYAVID